MNVFEMNILSVSKRVSNESKVQSSEVNEIRNLLDDFDNKMLLMIKEIRQCAKNEDLRVLQKYIEMWEPIRFVTRREVEKIVTDIIEKKFDK